MKKFVLAAALATVSSTAFAGGMVEPIMDPEPIVVETKASSSAGGILVPLLLLVVAAAVSKN